MYIYTYFCFDSEYRVHVSNSNGILHWYHSGITNFGYILGHSEPRLCLGKFLCGEWEELFYDEKRGRLSTRSKRVRRTSRARVTWMCVCLQLRRDRYYDYVRYHTENCTHVASPDRRRTFVFSLPGGRPLEFPDVAFPPTARCDFTFRKIALSAWSDLWRRQRERVEKQPRWWEFVCSTAIVTVSL